MATPFPLPSLSELQAWPTDHFDTIADWCDNEADRWEDSFTEAHQLVRDADWAGRAHDAAVHRSELDLGKARGGGAALRDVAKVLRMGAENERFAKIAALRVVAEALAAGYVVGEDLSITDTVTYTSWDQATERRAAARGFAADIRTEATSLVRIDQDLAARLPVAGAELHNVRFDQGGERNGIQLVGHGFPLSPGGPLPDAPESGTGGIEVADDAINRNSAIFPPDLKPNDPEFAARQLGGLERTALGTKGRLSGEAAVQYLRARGQNTAADLLEHYLANESGGRDPSLAKSFQLSTAQTDALANDSRSIYPEASSLPTVLENARSAALADAARSGQSVYTEVYGGADSGAAMGRGWTPVAGSEPGNVYALGRYSVQVVTQVDATSAAEPVVRQRYFVYDLTDYAHPGSITGGVMDRAKLSTIDDLATLRDIGWARAFDTFGTSSVRTYPQ